MADSTSTSNGEHSADILNDPVRPQSLADLPWPSLNESQASTETQADTPTDNDLVPDGGDGAAVDADVSSPPLDSQGGDAPPESPSTAMLEYFEKKYGQRPQYQSDDELLDVLSESWERVQQAPSREELERFQSLQPVLSQYAQNAAEFQQFLQQKQQSQQKQPESAATEAEAPSWAPPKVSEETRRLLAMNAFDVDPKTNRYTTTNPDYALHVKEANDEIRWQRETLNRLTNDPWSLMKDAGAQRELESLQQKLKEDIRQEILQEFQQREQEERARAQEAEDLKLFVQTDPQGNPLVQQGVYVLNERGKAFQAGIAEAQRFGITDQQKQIEFARHRALEKLPVESDAATPEDTTAAPAPTVTESRKQKQASFIDRAKQSGKQTANRLEQRNGTIASAAAAAESQHDTDDMDAVWKASMEQAREAIL